MQVPFAIPDEPLPLSGTRTFSAPAVLENDPNPTNCFGRPCQHPTLPRWSSSIRKVARRTHITIGCFQSRNRAPEGIASSSSTHRSARAVHVPGLPAELQRRPKRRHPQQPHRDLRLHLFKCRIRTYATRQSIPYSYVVRLVFFMGGDINTLMDVLKMTRKLQFTEAMSRCQLEDPGARRFFQHDFYSTEFNATRQQVKTRLYEIISRPELI